MLNVGLTGGIACGKSTVAKMLVGRGAHLIDFDKLAHEVCEPEKPAWREIVRTFGAEILAANKKIDRNKLGRIVFDDKKKLKTLSDIVHPYIFKEWRTRLKAIRKADLHAVVLSDVPLLYEENLQHYFDLTLLILIPPEEQIRRLMARSRLSHEEAEKRLKSQIPIGEKIRLADIIIDNRGTVVETEEAVAEVWRDLLEREEARRKSQ